MQGRPKLQCSFCGKPQNQVKRLIAGPTVYICNECVMLCVDVLRDEVDFTIEAPDEQRESFRWGPSTFVHLLEGTGVTVAIDALEPWAHFVDEGEELEWVAGRRDGFLVVGVRARGYQGAALGMAFPGDTEPGEAAAREVARARRASGKLET
jgi:hypothetical protein